jgi:RimJ/RimL family protein N-acetyltransferase
MSNDWIIYQGQKMALGPMRREYIDLLMPWVNDSVATRGVIMKPPMTLAQEIAWFESIGKDSSQLVFAILAKTDESYRYVGHTGLHKITWPVGIGSTGSFIGDTSVHAKGIGSEAKLWLLYHAFHVLGLQKVISSIKAFNGNSFGHLLKCGYKVIGKYKDHIFHNGRLYDEILFEVFRNDFDPIWEAYQNGGIQPSLTNQQKEQMKSLMIEA